MQIPGRSMQNDFEGSDSAQGVGQRRMISVGHARVGDDYRIAGKFVSILFEKRSQAFAPHFLFAFDDERDVTLQFRAGFQVSLDRFEVREILTFIVASAASEQGTALDTR